LYILNSFLLAAFTSPAQLVLREIVVSWCRSRLKLLASAERIEEEEVSGDREDDEAPLPITSTATCKKERTSTIVAPTLSDEITERT